jgi:molybdate transport system substrate-binding protein
MTMRSLPLAAAASAAAFLILFTQQPSANAAEIRVICSNGIKAVVEGIRPQFEHTSGNSMVIQYGSTAVLKRKIDSGEAFDAVILGADAVDDLAKAGKVAGFSVADVARAGVGVGVRAGARKPDIQTSDGMKRTLLAAKSVTYATEGASRAFIEKMYDHFGIANEMKPKIMLSPGSGESDDMVAQGKADIVLTLVSEILPAAPGVVLVGPLPPEVQGYVNFRAGVAANAKNVDGAKALVQFLKGPAAAPIYKAKGMEAR